MKKIVLLILLATSMFAKVEWIDIFDAYDDAKASNKVVMVMLSRQGCPGCERMFNVVFEDKKVSKLLKEDFISVNIDVYEDSVPKNLDYFATPTFYFLDGDEKILKRLDGGENAGKFIKTLESLKK